MFNKNILSTTAIIVITYILQKTLRLTPKIRDYSNVISDTKNLVHFFIKGTGRGNFRTSIITHNLVDNSFKTVNSLFKRISIADDYYVVQKLLTLLKDFHLCRPEPQHTLLRNRKE